MASHTERVFPIGHLLEEPKTVDCLMEVGFTIILVSDEAKAITKLSALSQSYFANTIHFQDYIQEQAVKILHSKANHLPGEGCYKESLVAKVATLCNGNIGYGESLLLNKSPTPSLEDTILPSFSATFTSVVAAERHCRPSRIRFLDVRAVRSERSEILSAIRTD